MSITLRELYTKEAANKAAIETAAEAATETAVGPTSSPSIYTSSKYI